MREQGWTFGHGLSGVEDLFSKTHRKIITKRDPTLTQLHMGFRE